MFSLSLSLSLYKFILLLWPHVNTSFVKSRMAIGPKSYFQVSSFLHFIALALDYFFFVTPVLYTICLRKILTELGPKYWYLVYSLRKFLIYRGIDFINREITNTQENNPRQMLSKPLAVSSASWDPSQKGELTFLLSFWYLVSFYPMLTYVGYNMFPQKSGVCLGLMEFKRPQFSALRSYTLGSKVSILYSMCLFLPIDFYP